MYTLKYIYIYIYAYIRKLVYSPIKIVPVQINLELAHHFISTLY